MPFPTQNAKAAWLWGVIFSFVTFGVNYAVGMNLFGINLTRFYIQSGLPLRYSSLFYMTFNFGISLIGYFIAALLAGHQARSVVAGTFAGLIAAAIENGIVTVGDLVLLRVQYLPSPVITDDFITDVMNLVILLGLGAGIGALGGLAGRSFAGYYASKTPP